MTRSEAASTLVEGVTADGAELALLLSREGAPVRLAGRAPGRAPSAEILRLLQEHGVAVEPDEDLDADPGAPATAYLDVWTPETAPRVHLLRAAGARLTGIADAVLERAPGPVLGVTGTAGKTTAAALALRLLRAAGLDARAAAAAPAGQLWPAHDLLAALPALRSSTWLVLELTSSHLAVTERSPHVAVVTSFWPDHLELHGSLEAYRAAKERLVASQTNADWVVVDEDVPDVAAFARRTSARRASFSRTAPVLRGAYLDRGALAARWGGRVVEVGPAAALPLPGRLLGGALAACAAALAAGVPPERLAPGLAGFEPPAHRGREVARWDGVPVVDATMAATPAKAAAMLEPYPDASVVLVAGGLTELAGLPVGVSPAEERLLAEACAEARRAAGAIVLFGPAAERLQPLLAGAERVGSLEEALTAGRDRARGAASVLVAPMFPLAAEERERLAARARARA